MKSLFTRYRFKNILIVLLLGMCILSFQKGLTQFTSIEDFRGSDDLNTVIGDKTYLTSSVKGSDNTGNTTSHLITPAPPTIEAAKIEYSQYPEALPLSVMPEKGSTLWVLSDGDVTATVPYIPSTKEPDTTEYWVTQKISDGDISEFGKITVTVKSAPPVDPGKIGYSQEICPDTQPGEIISINEGTTGEGLSYIWQKTTDNGQTWTTIPDETGATFQPGQIEGITSFRRVTVDASGNQFSTDPVTIFMITDGDCETSLCTASVQGEEFYWDIESPNSSTITQTIYQPTTDAGFVFDIYELDNSFNMEVNGTQLAVHEIEFQSNKTDGINIQFEDGAQYEENTEGTIWEMSGEPEKPLIRIVISPSGQVQMFGSKVSSTDPDYELFPLEFIPEKGNSFNTIQWNTLGNSDTNEITVSQNVVSKTAMKGYGSGKNLVSCFPYSLEKDGIFNDEDENGSAQPGETITYTFSLTNEADFDIYDPEISDPLLDDEIDIVLIEGDENNDGVLKIGETWVYTVDYCVSQDEINEGGVYNQASVQGKTVEGYVLDPEGSTDPTPISPTSSYYDPDRPDHTFVHLPPEWAITNPMLPSKGR